MGRRLEAFVVLNALIFCAHISLSFEESEPAKDEDKFQEWFNEQETATEDPDPLRFHPRTAHNMYISEDGTKAFRKINHAFGNTAALTNRVLKPGEVFEVWLESQEYVENPRIGVTEFSPEKIVYPDYMNHLDSDTWGWDVWPNQIYQDAEIIMDPYTKVKPKIKRGDRFGVSVNEEGALHFHHNGVDLGEAAIGLYAKYYGYIDLYWGGSNASLVNAFNFVPRRN